MSVSRSCGGMRHAYRLIRGRAIGSGNDAASRSRSDPHVRDACAPHRGWPRRSALIIVAAFLVPLFASSCMFGRDGGVPWYEARRDPTGLAPDPAIAREAVIQVYAARAIAWRGTFAVHTWIAVKPTDAPRYQRFEVVGFGVANGQPAVRVDRMGPDNYWFGARPELILDRRGDGVDALIERV